MIVLTSSIFATLMFFSRNSDLIMLKLIKFFYYSFLVSIVMTFFLNPGIPGRKYFRKNSKIEEGNTYTFCNKCNLIVPDELNIVHCDHCNICILNYDHHCDWIGKCVGKGNILCFVCFLFSLFLFILSSLFTLFIIFTQIQNNKIK